MHHMLSRAFPLSRFLLCPPQRPTKVLEGTPEGAAAAAYLRQSFAAMVAMQLQAADEAGGRPRFVDRKGRTANRNSTPPRRPAHEKKGEK